MKMDKKVGWALLGLLAVGVTIGAGSASSQSYGQHRRYQLSQGAQIPGGPMLHNTVCLRMETSSGSRQVDMGGCSNDMPWFLDERAVMAHLSTLQQHLESQIRDTHTRVVSELQNIGREVRAEVRGMIAEAVREELARQGCTCRGPRPAQ
jgi:Spy/CpxP family protein refolding chaperone